MLTVAANANVNGTGCDACPDTLSQRPVWEITFEGIGPVNLCIFHLEQLIDELVLIKKHKVHKSQFSLGHH